MIVLHARLPIEEDEWDAMDADERFYRVAEALALAWEGGEGRVTVEFGDRAGPSGTPIEVWPGEVYTPSELARLARKQRRRLRRHL